jgi:hypothetical protein
MFFQGTSPEKVMSCNFFQLRFKSYKVMAGAKISGHLLSGCLGCFLKPHHSKLLSATSTHSTPHPAVSAVQLAA